MKNRLFAGFVPRLLFALGAILMWFFTTSIRALPFSIASQKSDKAEKTLINRNLHWGPPMIETPVRSTSTSPPCLLPGVLEKASARALALADNLQQFAALEYISYQSTARLGDTIESGTGTFDYVVDFKQTSLGLVVDEARNPRRGSNLSPVITQDVGLSEISLIFLPEMQVDYVFECEATAQWHHQTAWVVHFRQRNEKSGRTLAFRGHTGVYPARLQGRAWVAADSGEVLHLETGLLEEIPAVNVRRWYLSVSYAPVQFRFKNVTMWLPQAVDAYCEFDDHRTIVYHTFTNFVLSSVRTEEQIEAPKNP